MGDNSTLEKIRKMVTPLVNDLKLDLYDIEFRGGTLRITVDTLPGSPGGIDVDMLTLVTKMISRDFDHDDPMPGHYTLEVTSPGLERTLRLPAHFKREIGKTVAFRLRDTAGGDRRVQGVLIAADDEACTVRLDDAAMTERTIAYLQIDRARTVFVWGPAPKPGKQASKSSSRKKTPAASSAESSSSTNSDDAVAADLTVPSPQEAS